MTPSARALPALAVALTLGVAACTGRTPSAAPLGCGVVAPSAITGLLGPHARSARHGSLDALRAHGRPVSCTSTASDGPVRLVAVRVERHPRPLRLPSAACNEGWVYAGTPQKYAPACQVAIGHGGRTVLLARWGAYVVRVRVDRDDRAWAGDPELALAMTEQVARRLGVPVPAQSASGSSS